MEVITTHTGCDFDGLASMVAAVKLYPGAKIYISPSPSQEVRDFMHLYGWMIPAERFEPERIKEVKRLILVDTRWVSRIGILGKLVEEKKVEIHIYDHHPSHPGEIKGDLEICREVGAATSIMVDLIKKKNISITPFEATLFTLGIYEDTGSLSFSSTTSFDLQAVAYLLERGAKLEFISNFLNRGLTEKQYILLKDFIEKAKVIFVNGVEIVMITTRVDDFVGGLSSPLHKFIDLKNPDVVFAVIGSKDKVYVMARSRLPFVDVDEILSFMGGGGHSLAASAVLKNVDLKSVEERIQKILREKIRSYPTVEKVMRASVKMVSPEVTAGEVKEILDRGKLDALPIREKGKIVGAISRPQIEFIIKRSSASTLIKGYYSKKFTSISPSISLKRAEQIMMEEETPWLFVFKGQEFQGIITSFDIFNAFHSGSISPCENLAPLLKKKVPPEVMGILQQAGEVAHTMGFLVFIVGGFVRDLLLGNENFDIDLLVEGDGIAFAKNLAQKLKARLTVHPEFGTATLDLREGFKFDIATSRREFYPRPAALPRIERAPLREDLFRRDFTVNAMAISINPSDFGRLIDFFDGKKDLEASRVRVLHPKSFIDDPTRIFRAVRFEQRYGFKIDKDTENLIKEAVRENIFQYVSGKRIKEELIQILEEDRPDKNIRRMEQLGILKLIHPGISLTLFKEKILDRLVDAIATYEVLTGERSRRWLTRLALLLDGAERQQIESFSHRYSFTREEKETLFVSCRGWREIVKKLKVPKIKPSSIYFFLKSYPREALIIAMAGTESKLVKKRVILYLSSLQKVTLEISGNDLKKMGYRPSPEFSRILEEAKKAKLNGSIKTREEEIDFIRKNFLLRRK